MNAKEAKEICDNANFDEIGNAWAYALGKDYDGIETPHATLVRKVGTRKLAQIILGYREKTIEFPEKIKIVAPEDQVNLFKDCDFENMDIDEIYQVVETWR